MRHPKAIAILALCATTGLAATLPPAGRMAQRSAPPGEIAAALADSRQTRRPTPVVVDDVVGVAGFALPGNHVDIVVNTQLEPGTAGHEDERDSRTLLADILVLGADREANRHEAGPRVLTLDLTPEEADKLDLARDLLAQLREFLRFNRVERELSHELLELAWQHYFAGH